MSSDSGVSQPFVDFSALVKEQIIINYSDEKVTREEMKKYKSFTMDKYKLKKATLPTLDTITQSPVDEVKKAHVFSSKDQACLLKWGAWTFS